MLYEQVKKDIFSNNTELSLSHESIQAPSVTTIVLLQVQASMVQVISKLRSENKKPIRNMVKLPLRWGFLVGLLVVDNVARVLHVDQEMASIQKSNEKNQFNHDSSSSSTTSDDDDPINDNESIENHRRHTQFIIPTKSKSSTIPSSYHQQPIYPKKSSSTDLLSTSPHLAPPPLPLLLKSSNGLRVRSRKTSSPAAILTQSSSSITTNPTSQRQLNGVRQRSISNNIHDGNNRINQPTVRRVNTQRELKIISPSVSSSTSNNGIRRQTSFNNLNVKRSTSQSKKK